MIQTVQKTQQHFKNKFCLTQTLPCSIVHSLSILPFAWVHPSRSDPQKEEETAGHHQMADSRERQTFLGFPLLVPLLLGIQLTIWADWALHAAGEGGGAEGLVDCHVLLHLHGLPGGHEGFKDFCERQDRHLRIRCVVGTICVFVIWVCWPTSV